jgi:hypothetical protein
MEGAEGEVDVCLRHRKKSFVREIDLHPNLSRGDRHPSILEDANP